MPSNALKAGSNWPLLAVKTALTIEVSIDGKASRRVSSACSRGLSGRGGFAGGASSFGGGFGPEGVWFIGVDMGVPDSGASSSKSSGLAVVGDSGGKSAAFVGGERGETGECYDGQERCSSGRS